MVNPIFPAQEDVIACYGCWSGWGWCKIGARQLSGAVLATDINVTAISGFPIATSFVGLNIDVDNDSQSAVSTISSADLSEGYAEASGWYASESEAAIWDELFGAESSVSTSRIINAAARDAVPILKFDANNISRISAITELPTDVVDEIVAAIDTGAQTVLVPATEVAIGQWTGIGYVVTRNQSRDFRISGGRNGGVYNEVQDMDDASVKTSGVSGDTLLCLWQIHDTADALRLITSAVAASFVMIYNIVRVSRDSLASAPSIYMPFILMLQLTLGIYALLQAAFDDEGCV